MLEIIGWGSSHPADNPNIHNMSEKLGLLFGLGYVVDCYDWGMWIGVFVVSCSEMCWVGVQHVCR